MLRESFYSLKKKAAPGVDGVTWQEYETGIEDRLVDLHSRVHRGAYRGLPSRRVYIKKEDGRPIGHCRKHSGTAEGKVHRAVEWYWRKVLSSRSWKGQVCWKQFQQTKERFPLLRPKLHLPYGALQALATTL